VTTYQCRMITVSVDRDWREVYDFASIPENFSRWAAGLGRRFERAEAGEWIAEDPDGRPIRIRFSPPNEFGVLDHTVRVDGRETRNAMRVVQNGTGAEVTFVLLRTPAMTEETFAADAAQVQRDHETLKALLEG
jgi:hypothetical protein